MIIRSALVDLANAASADADILDYLNPLSEARPELVAAKPDAFDPHDDAAIDPAKWETVGTVTEQTWLGVDGLTIDGGATPAYDQAGVIYKPAITAANGKVVFCRAIMERPVEYIMCLQEYDFTGAPGSYSLKYTTAPQDLRNSMGLRIAPGAVYFFEGGAAGNEEFLMALPSRPSVTGEVYPIQVAFVFTATGWNIYMHLPGIWSDPQVVKAYTRPGGVHATNGYCFCSNLRSSEDKVHQYELSNFFKSNVLVTGGRIITANETDQVVISGIQVDEKEGVNAFQPGSVLVRVPDYSSNLLTLEQLAEVTEKLTGKQVYAIEFELNGDVGIKHPVRVSIEDQTLTEEPTAQAEC